MVLTFIAASIFLVLNFVVGNWIGVFLSRIFITTATFLFANLLLGFSFISIWLNLWSFFLPVTFNALIPVVFLCCFVYKHSLFAIRSITSSLVKLFTTSFAFITIPFFSILIAYALLPPQHGDSIGYHFLSIRWIEDYKVIPGLANIHGRFGFNSSFFVSSAAFVFTKLTGQSLYVLNIVFVFSYYMWLLNKVYVYRNVIWSVVLVFVAIAMFRQLLIGISSPTPDVLTSIIISYVFIRVVEETILHKRVDERQCVLLIILICFAFTVKLNSFPLSLIAVYLIIQSGLYKKRQALIFSVVICSIIILPWLIRNYILTGYLIYPVASTGFLHPDWQVPFDVLRFDKLLINNGPKMIPGSWESIDTLSFTQWFPLWIKANLNNGLASNLALLIAAIISCCTTFLIAFKKRLSEVSWLAIITLASIIFWIYNSPDYRFGYPYILNGILLFGLYITGHKPLKTPVKIAVSCAVIMLCGYYLPRALTILSPVSFVAYIIKPLQVKGYDPNNSLASFPYIRLNENVKLYTEDSGHWCNISPLPCYECYYEKLLPTQIELRGKNIQDGFRIKPRR